MIWILAKILFAGFGIGFGVFFAIFMVIILTDNPGKAMRLRKEGYDTAIYEITHNGQFYDRQTGNIVRVKLTKREEANDHGDADSV